MMENLLLAAMGGALGLLLARWSLSFVHAQLPANIARRLQGAEALSIDHRVLAFGAGVSLLTVLLFGFAPALNALRFDLMSSLRDSSKGAAPGRNRFGQALVITEIALSLVLLISAGLMLKSILGLQRQNLGFSPENVLQTVVDTSGRSSIPFDEIVQRIQALPGVETVGLVGPQLFPFGGPQVRGSIFEIQGNPAEPRAESYYASPGYFRSVQIPLLKGRVFSSADTKNAVPVAILSNIVAQRYWGDRDPIGQRIRLNPVDPDSPWLTIVGVVGDVRNPVGLDVQPTTYRPIAQTDAGSATIMIQTGIDPLLLADAVRRELRTALPEAPEFRMNHLEAAVRNYISPQRFTTTVLGIFAALGLVLACAGVYGVMRYWVAVRVPEIGLRLALGARRADVMSLVLTRAAKAAAVGLTAGIAGSLALQRVIASQLYGVSPTDPAVLIAVSGILGAVAIGAALVPAIWAARIDPMAALRHE
jgi:predicted permease